MQKKNPWNGFHGFFFWFFLLNSAGQAADVLLHLRRGAHIVRSLDERAALLGERPSNTPFATGSFASVMLSPSGSSAQNDSAMLHHPALSVRAARRDYTSFSK